MVCTISSVIEGLDIKRDPNKTLVSQLDSIVQEFLNRTDSYNKLHTRIYQHSLRTMNIAEMLLRRESADKEVVMISLLLHDIGKTMTPNKHDIVSYNVAREILPKLGVSQKKIDKILDCILMHSSKDIFALDLTMEQKVVMDADILDEIGCLSIVKQTLKSKNRNKDANLLLTEFEELLNKVIREEVNVKTKYGKILYSRRRKALKDLIDDYKNEIEMFKIK